MITISLSNIIGKKEEQIINQTFKLSTLGASKVADDLLKLFVDEHAHMAIVKEGEITLGLATLEDVLEELIGEIEDEFDRLPKTFHALSENHWLVGGGIPVEELNSRTGLQLTDSKGTISSWIGEKLKKEIPEVGDMFSLPSPKLDFLVRQKRRGMIFEVEIIRQNQIS